MYPVLFQIGPFSLHSLWLFVSIAFIISILKFSKIAKRQRLDLTPFHNHGLTIIMITLLTSRLVFFLMNQAFYMPTFSFNRLLGFFYIWDKGLSFWGGLAGFIFILIIVLIKRGENILRWLDALVIPLGIGIIIANFGQLLDGQGYGRETILPWGITYQSINVKYTVPIHPTQIYSMLYISGILYFFNRFKKHNFFEKDGNKTLAAIAIYSLCRFGSEFFRGDDTVEIFGIRLAAIISLTAFLISGWFLRKRNRFSSSTSIYSKL